MRDTRTLICGIVTISFLISCGDVRTIPTSPDATSSPSSGPNANSSPGVIVVRVVSFSEDLVNLAWSDSDSTTSLYGVERRDADTSQYVVLAELGPWVKKYADGGVKQVFHRYHYRISTRNGESESVFRRHGALPEPKAASLRPSHSRFSRLSYAPVEFHW